MGKKAQAVQKSKKIILFLSNYNEKAVNVKDYLCPDGQYAPGVQTYEAPIRYLLRAHPDVSEIICIVTPEARASAWEHFMGVVRERNPAVVFTAVDFAKGQDFSREPLAQIMAALEAKGNEILLETTGGLRDAVMELLLLSRILSYKGIPTVEAVYSNFQAGRVEDVSHLIRLFDLVGGMQELTSFGSVRTLRTYYGADPDPKIDELLTAMEQLSEAITLCRTKLLQERMDRFDGALRAAEDCADPMMRQLLPVFRAKFGKKLTITGLIKWCIQSDMLQQALTVYTERIPEVIITRGDILQIDRDAVWQPAVQEYEDPSAVLFTRGLLMLSASSADAEVAVNTPQRLKNYARENAAAIVRKAKTNTWRGAPVPEELQVGVENLVVLVRAVYGDGAFNYTWPAALPKGKQHLQILAERLNDAHPQDPYRMLNHVSTFSEEHMQALLEQQPEDGESVNYHVQTIQYLERLLPGSGYEPRCSVEQLQAILQDYLYIKALRNMTNHANHEGTSTQNSLMEYLAPLGYKPLEEVSLADLKDTLDTALRHLQTNRKKEWTR